MDLTSVRENGSQRSDSVRSRILTYASIVAASALLGICAPLLASSGGQVGQAAHLVLSAGWSWAALAFFVGMSGTSKRFSAVAGTIALVGAVVLYYVTKAAQGDYQAADLTDVTGQTTYLDWNGFLTKVVLWGFFACLLGPLLGIAGNLARASRHRLPCRLLIPLVAVVESSMRLQNEASVQGDIATTTWAAIRIVAVAAVVVLVSLSVLGGWRRRSTSGL